jgi:hypothetical protein
MDKTAALVPAWQKRLHLLVMITLVVSGFGQMPLFKRYYISDIPGMAWSANFFITHNMHYVAGAVFLFMTAMWTVRYFRDWRKTHVLTTLGAVRVGLYAGIALTGLIRTPGNLNGWHWNPALTMALDLGHLALVMLLGAASALAFMSFGGYLEHRDAVAERKARLEREKALREKENQVRARGAKPSSGCAPSG